MGQGLAGKELSMQLAHGTRLGWERTEHAACAWAGKPRLWHTALGASSCILGHATMHTSQRYTFLRTALGASSCILRSGGGGCAAWERVHPHVCTVCVICAYTQGAQGGAIPCAMG
eukprot:1159068-Pelagomonas_calceolata.AAC.7